MPCIHIHLSKEDNKASGMEITVKVIIEEDFSKKKKKWEILLSHEILQRKKSHIKNKIF